MTRRRTLRWIALSDRERVHATLHSHALGKTLSWATAFDRAYARFDGELAGDEVFGGTELPETVEVFRLRCVDPVAAAKLAQHLTGAGGLTGIADLVVVRHELLIEYTASPLMLFALVDHLAGRQEILREAVLPLADVTLIKSAAHQWNTKDLEPMRILEIAAGEVPW